MNWIKIRTALCLVLLLVFLSGCSWMVLPFLPQAKPTAETTQEPFSGGSDVPDTTPEPSGAAAENGKIQLQVAAPEDLSLRLEHYDGGYFTIEIPTHWAIEATGAYENFGFRLYDPNKPQRQAFFYGSMSPFLKSADAKQAWETYVSTGGFGDAQLYADAPVLSPPTTEQFFYTFDAYTAFAYNYGITHSFPAFNDLQIVEATPRNSPISGVAADDSIVRGLFTDGGLPCEGLFAAGVVDAMTSYMYDVDAGYYTVYVISGIAAPADEFAALEKVLAESLSSFTFSQDYINAGVAQNQWETNAALQVAKTLSDAYDSYNQAWHDRQPVYDALSQKYSDATLGYDRLYDPETGAVYRAETGFYDQYADNRDDYSNPGLQLVPDNAYDLYSQELSGYIYKS